MASKLAEDPRIDPRLKEVFGSLDVLTATGDVASREDLLAEELTEAGKARAAAVGAILNSFDNETIAPSAGLSISRTRRVGSRGTRTTQLVSLEPG
jgi:acetyl esterase